MDAEFIPDNGRLVSTEFTWRKITIANMKNLLDRMHGSSLDLVAG